MATVRAARVTTAIYDPTPGENISVSGLRTFGLTGRRNLVRGRSDGELGNTSADVTGMELTGFLEVDEFATAAALNGASNSPASLVVSVTKGGGAAGSITIDNVVITDVRQSPISANPDGISPTFRISFRGVFAAADDGFDDVLTFV